MNTNEENLEIKYHGESRTLKYMKEYLETGHAEYWYWHILLYDTIHMYQRALKKRGFGVLLPDTIIIGKFDAFELQTKMANGVYPKEDCFKLIDMYIFLTNERLGD